MAVQIRRGTTTQISESTVVLAPGEPGVDLNTGETRYGNGADLWASLPSPVSEIALNVRTMGAVGNGTTDDTAAVQAALNKGKTVYFPAGTYLCGALSYKSGTRIYGTGTIKHKATGGFTGQFPRAILSPQVQPTYKAPDSTGRETVTGLTTDVSIEGVTLDGNGVHVYGLQVVAVDRALVSNVTIKNCSGGLDIRASRYSKFLNVLCDNISEDGISVTDQNFAAGTGRGITTRLSFEDCVVQNSQTSNGLGTSSMNAFEMDDGMTFIDFIRCRALNSRGCGFEIHVHNNEYDMTDIRFIDCVAMNCAPNSGDDRQVAGFMIGQCPLGTSLSRISFSNCTSIGSPNAFARIPGAETGTVTQVTIQGGYWKSTAADSSRSFLRSTCMYIGKQFDDWKITGATIAGAVNGFGVYTYASGAGSLTITDCNIVDSYTPFYLGGLGGTVTIRGGRAVPGVYTTTASTVCAYILAANVVLSDFTMVVDSAQYTSSPIRLIGPATAKVGVVMKNTNASVVGNALYVQDAGLVSVSGSVITGFANALFFSGTSTSLVSSGNSFKGCTAKYNSTPTALVDSGNSI